MIALKILLTGGAGFIGSHIAELLVEKGIPVVVVDNLSRGKLLNLKRVQEKLSIYKVDITSPALMHIFQREMPTHVIHQAAQVSVQNSLEKPLLDARTNILGTLNVLECCRLAGVQKVVYASSAAVYGRQEGSLDEGAAQQPKSAYGLSKLTGEKYLQMYREIYGIDYVILRYANVYGPRQSLQGEGGVIAIFIDRLLRGEKPVIYGDGEQTRDFVFVEDVARANLLALHSHGSEIVNIGTNTALTINQLLEELIRLTGIQTKPSYKPPRPGDLKHSRLANKKAQAFLGWSPQVSLPEGLAKTIAYYQEELVRKQLGSNQPDKQLRVRENGKREIAVHI